MAAPTYKTRVIVLRKTKLSDYDLILTLLSEDGSQLKAIAKGARKPSSPFSSRLEQFSESDVLLARGRSLDIVKEARLVDGHERLRSEMERCAGAAPVTELLCRTTEPGLTSPRLFALTSAALAALEGCGSAHVPAMCAAFLVKELAMVGLRPSLSVCCSCGRPVDLAADPSGDVPFSFIEGGVVCLACRPRCECVPVASSTVVAARAYLGSTFARLKDLPPDVSAAFGVLRLSQRWCSHHVGARLKSLEFLFRCGLF